LGFVGGLNVISKNFRAGTCRFSEIHMPEFFQHAGI
jgi:hypothetical protein